MSSDPMSQQANNNKKEEEQFPIKLHRILEEAEANGFADCISWMPDGTSFKIFDKTRLESEVMPQYFESCQFKSFQRSLNMWGFVADNKKSDTTTGGGRRHHPLFVKGRPELCCAMRRVRVKKPGARGKKALEAEKLTTPPDSPTRTARQHEDQQATTTVHSGFLAPCLQGSRYDHAMQNVTTDNCTGLIQQLCQGQSSSNALLHALLATRLQQQGRDQDRSIMLSSQPSSHQADIPTIDFANRSLLVSTLSKLLSTATTTNHTPPSLQHVVMPSIIGQALTSPALAPLPVVNQRGSFSQENVVDEAALRQAAIALAAVGWNSPPPPPSKNPESYFMMDPQQYCEKLLTMNMLLQHQQQQQQSSTYSSSSVLSEAIRKNLVQGTGGEGYGGGGTRSRSTSTTSTSSPRQNNSTNGGLESPHPQVSLSSSTLQNPTMNTLDLASSLLLQHYSLASSIGPSS